MDSNATDNSNVRIGLSTVVPEWSRNVMITFITIAMITGLPGNIFLILVQINTKTKTTTDWFVAFLAVSDILSLAINGPMYIFMVTGEWQNIGSQLGCNFHHFFIVLTFSTQNIIVACNAVDRLWKSSSVLQIFSSRQAKYSGIIAFTFSVAEGTVAAFAVSNNNLRQCVLDPSRKLLQVILYLIILIGGLTSSGVVIVSYARILTVLSRRNRVAPIPNASRFRVQETALARRIEGRYRKALRTTKIMFIVTCVFITTTLLPNIGVLIISGIDYRKSEIITIIVFLFTRLYLINNCVNPYIYFCLSSAFRRKIAYILKVTHS